jgi:hypothetical protein
MTARVTFMRMMVLLLLTVACRPPLQLTVVSADNPIFNVPDHPLITRLDVVRCDDNGCVSEQEAMASCDCACLRAPDGSCTDDETCDGGDCMWSIKRQNPGSDTPGNYFDALAVPIAYGEERPENGLSRTIEPVELANGSYLVVAQAKPVRFTIGSEPFDTGSATFVQP